MTIELEIATIKDRLISLENERSAYAESMRVLKQHHPMPWYLETSNDSEVCVSDSRGNDIFRKLFPGELPDRVREQIAGEARALAQFLMAQQSSE